MSKHTPGPWRTGDLFNTVFGPPNGQPVAEIISTVRHSNRRIANARLIAAAPDMLAFIEKWRDITDLGIVADFRDEFDAEADAVIAKATSQ